MKQPSRFEFSLAPALEAGRAEVERCERELLELRNRRDVGASKLRALEAHARDADDAFRALTPWAQDLDAPDFQEFDLVAEVLRLRVRARERQRLEQLLLEEQVIVKEEELLEVSARVDGFERLNEEELRNFEHARRRAEEKELGEIARLHAERRKHAE